jgi:hypothetical protein
MSMKFRTILAMFSIILLAATTAGAWGLPSALSGSTSPAADPDTFLEKAQKAEQLVDRSAHALFNAVANKTQKEKVEALQKKLNETSDNKEKDALTQEIRKTEMAAIEERTKDKKLQAEAQHYDAKKKALISASFYNFTLGSLKSAELVPEGTKIADSIRSNPTNAVRLATKLNSVVSTVSSLKGIIENTGKVVSHLKPLMSAAKIEAKAATNSSEGAKDVDL